MIWWKDENVLTLKKSLKFFRNMKYTSLEDDLVEDDYGQLVQRTEVNNCL